MSQALSEKAPEGAKSVENFFGVYLLYSTNPRYRGSIYIGKTTDPNRRIFQHNKGRQAGGAAKTSRRGPWDMVLVVHGFPNDISALRFEWAWQHPASSRRLSGVPRKAKNEKSFPYHLRLLATMLNLGPWNRLPLTLRWLKPEYQPTCLPGGLSPPLHMPVVLGPVSSRRLGPGRHRPGETETETELCNLCFQTVSLSARVSCLYPLCQAVSHLVCLSSHFLGGTEGLLLPLTGSCPTCDGEQGWGDIIRKRKGCYDLAEGGQREVEDEEGEE